MSREFLGNINQRLFFDGVPVAEPPFTVAGWFYIYDSTAYRAMFTLYLDSANHYIMQATTGNQIQAYTEAINIHDEAVTTTTFEDNTWNHAFASFPATNRRIARLNAGGEDIETTDRVPLLPDETYIGIRGTASDMNGRLAELAVWDTALTHAENWQLSNGVPPIFIRPQNLVAYWPLVSAEDLDWFRRYDMTAQNGPTTAIHPPKVLEFWRRYQRRAVTTQAISRLASWGNPNEWNLRVKSLVTRIPRYGFTNFQIPGIV